MIRLYNTRAGALEPFDLPPGSDVRMYVCGPTVYEVPHMGHARSYVVYDTLRRFLRHMGYAVRYVENFTDIEDSITRRALKEGVSPADIAERYIAAFQEDMQAVGVAPADEHPRVTQHVERMIAVAQDLVSSGRAYVLHGSVYLRTAELDAFGRLSHKKLEDIVADPPPEDGKESPYDFALWKPAKPGELSWESPWGRGRPGWNLQCYVMSTTHLGGPFDLHGGGMDLIFPHHEGENAVALAHRGKELSRFWIHNGFITVSRRKMSKSSGNFVTLREVLKTHEPGAIRLFLLSQHYRATLDYTAAAMKRVSERYQAVRRAVSLATSPRGEGRERSEAINTAADTLQALRNALANDLDTPAALAALERCCDAVDANAPLGKAEAAAARKTLGAYDDVLGLGLLP